jgi:hypothetical protein
LNVELHIERLVLTGVPLPPGGQAALAGAFGRELTRLIQDGGLGPALASGTGTPRLTATLGPAAAATRAGGGPRLGRELGRELARSVYSSLGGS